MSQQEDLRMTLRLSRLSAIFVESPGHVNPIYEIRCSQNREQKAKRLRHLMQDTVKEILSG